MLSGINDFPFCVIMLTEAPLSNRTCIFALAILIENRGSLKFLYGFKRDGVCGVLSCLDRVVSVLGLGKEGFVIICLELATESFIFIFLKDFCMLPLARGCIAVLRAGYGD